MTVYLLNSLVIPVDFLKTPVVWVRMRKADIKEVMQVLQRGFMSAIGHEGTARLLTELLGVQVPYNRVSVSLQPGDVAIHFVLKTRLPEGKVLSYEELQQLDFVFIISEVHGDAPPQRG
jgi:hypothetical protein